MHAVPCKNSVDVLETRARGPKTRVGGRYMETDRCKMDAGRSKMDTDFRKTRALLTSASATCLAERAPGGLLHSWDAKRH